MHARCRRPIDAIETKRRLMVGERAERHRRVRGRLGAAALRQVPLGNSSFRPIDQLTAQLLGAGRIDAASIGGPAVLPHIRSGKLRAIAVGSAERVPVLPDDL